MRPIVTADGFDLTPEVVLACLAVGLGVGIVGVILRTFLVASAVELGDLVRAATGRLGAAIVGRRHASDAQDPWLCRTCRSVNLATATTCYRRCGTRADLELPVAEALGLPPMPPRPSADAQRQAPTDRVTG